MTGSGGYLDISAAARFLCRSPRWVRGNLSWLPHFRCHGQILFREDELLLALEKFRVPVQHVDLAGLLDRVIPTRRRGSLGRFRGEAGA